MNTITSVHNPLIITTTKLAHAKYRAELGCFLAEGVRTCRTLIASGIQAKAVFVTETPQADISCFDPALVYLVSPAVMKKISQSSTPSGLVVVFEIPQQPSLSQLGSGILLYELQDPGNVGTLMRTCAALGKKTVICVGGVDPWHPKVIQACAGTIGQVTVFQLSWEKFHNIPSKPTTIALVPRGGKLPAELPLQDCILLVGNEGHGLPEKVIQKCDANLTLPMPGNTESLNAAIAGSIALYLGALHTGAL